MDDTSQVIIDQAVHAAVIQNLTENLKSHYVFPDLAERISERIQQYLEQGTYAQITEGELFAKTLTEHLQEVNQDKHLRVFWSPEPLPEQEKPAQQKPETVEEWRLGASLDNFGLYRVERLAGNVGYLDIRGFAPPEWAGDLAVAAMNFIANASA